MKSDRPKCASIEHDTLSISCMIVNGNSGKNQIELSKNFFLCSEIADADENKMVDFAHI